MSLHWKEDPHRPGNCWDYITDKGFVRGYVIKRASAPMWIAHVIGRDHDNCYWNTRDEAELYVAAIVALEQTS